MSINEATHHCFNSYLVPIVWITIIYLPNLLMEAMKWPCQQEDIVNMGHTNIGELIMLLT